MPKLDNIAIVPARSGSKGILNKNIRDLNGRPLMDYTIKAALESDCFDRVIVSTDCEEIADVAINCGAEVPFLRSKELASDTARTIDAVLEVLAKLQENYKVCCLLQVTAPLRSVEDIQESLKLFEKSEKDALVSVCKFEEPHPYKLKVIKDGNLLPLLSGTESETPRQLLPQCYNLNGAIYLNKVDFLKRSKTFFSERTEPFVMPSERSVNIDTPLDLVLAEALLNKAI